MARSREPASREAERATGSFAGLRVEHRAQRVDLVAARKGEKTLAGRGAVGEIAPQHAGDGLRGYLGLYVAIDLAPERRIGPEAAAHQDVIALDGVALVRGRHPRPDQPDVADIVLGAGVMASGEMDVHRTVEREARLAPIRDFLGVALGVGGREAAADIAGAGDEAGADRARLGGEAERRDGGLGERELVGRHARDQQVLPHGEPDIAVAEIGRDLGEPAHLLAGEPADRKYDADPMAAGLLL